MNNGNFSALNNLLHQLSDTKIFSQPLFVFITGASGAGKTHLMQQLEKNLDPLYSYCAYFDNIGVPSVETMIKLHGSCEAWQEETTHLWVKHLAIMKKDTQLVILEGQYNPEFAVDACARYGIEHYLLMVVHAPREVREQRLIALRQQPELVNETMNNWAEVLKAKTLALGGILIDNSDDTGMALQNIVHAIYGAYLRNLKKAVRE